MSARSVKLKFEDGGAIYISPREARLLLRAKEAFRVSESPFVLRARAHAKKRAVQRWAEKSDGVVPMSGRLLERNPQRL